MAEKYRFKREDNGKIVKVSFAEAYNRDVLGYITLKDGTQARYQGHIGLDRSNPAKKNGRLPGHGCEILSDAMGFTVHQLADFEKDRRKNGFRGVEFVEDREVPGFYQVRCKSMAEHEKYVRHRGLVCDNRTGGRTISATDLQSAINRERVKGHPPVRGNM